MEGQVHLNRLGLSPKVLDALTAGGYASIDALRRATEADLNAVPGLDKNSLNEIWRALAAHSNELEPHVEGSAIASAVSLTGPDNQALEPFASVRLDDLATSGVLLSGDRNTAHARGWTTVHDLVASSRTAAPDAARKSILARLTHLARLPLYRLGRRQSVPVHVDEESGRARCVAVLSDVLHTSTLRAVVEWSVTMEAATEIAQVCVDALDGMLSGRPYDMQVDLSISLAGIQARDRAALQDYYGLTNQPRTLEEIGRDLGLTRERVRQLVSRGRRLLQENLVPLPGLAGLAWEGSVLAPIGWEALIERCKWCANVPYWRTGGFLDLIAVTGRDIKASWYHEQGQWFMAPLQAHREAVASVRTALRSFERTGYVRGAIIAEIASASDVLARDVAVGTGTWEIADSWLVVRNARKTTLVGRAQKALQLVGDLRLSDLAEGLTRARVQAGGVDGLVPPLAVLRSLLRNGGFDVGSGLDPIVHMGPDIELVADVGTTEAHLNLLLAKAGAPLTMAEILIGMASSGVSEQSVQLYVRHSPIVREVAPGRFLRRSMRTNGPGATSQ